MGFFSNTLGAIGGLFEEAGAAVGDVVEDIGTAILGPAGQRGSTIGAAVGSAFGAPVAVTENKFVVFLRSGDTLRGKCQLNSSDELDVWYRQIATVNGTLVNPLGYSAA